MVFFSSQTKIKYESVQKTEAKYIDLLGRLGQIGNAFANHCLRKSYRTFSLLATVI
jgi:hypothetical protein